ncbi:D-alanyl-D-alanine carboxypeptidase/D-alanyl-D-alanine-endopeptidase [Mucilaginibacter rubeus]|uniref:D-alanyl-D-alanine carboxypeptidase/D-alanyl-D-alanine-endopeptidase n=1 Tax=Mucilaginibacter rubeus TaxID=2027860 RepID=A0AAE6JGH6_9SPHI|nr:MULTISPECIES: D-alanyl-D-alanine carboxypeptidase/D-alanyl-D-alanine-endopeptidase [Mucilaginibacter]QEM05141.1 D-alanyl-D-alanine carboxypeptidase/D-alanyl-D-alanine-endopeptidase [Mucilaginibacter rubeus]QEM17733.1 D-alanyl-D-alanine carboxypeptidase/D-alanyl-D-alanine-endopeptidase [Mucilaginibacter gossypii]QTE45740.1 D-alanyl-D-alanine carboxypeptidase/D-alanyl-D-alanine-endopeptidase [Mucilaginibacter rubeus]QTE52337.1 D-alanyl-D-alanine carboxypeptidase/D-alanyl-D-alanine-endopeptidas
MRRLLVISFLFIGGSAGAQTLQQKISNAFGRLQADSQCNYASVSLTVLDAKTGEQVFSGNPNMGLATASTLKTITSITAFNILGPDFQYQTQLGYTGEIGADGTLTGDIIIKGAGDPTLGSWRYEQTKEGHVLAVMANALQKAGVKKVNGRIIGDDSIFGTQSIPEGWIWQDIGNYYGAGTSGLCWRENQFDIKLRTGAVGSPVGISRTVPLMPYLSFKSELANGSAGSGDNAYAFLPVGSKVIYLRGTYAIDQDKKSISAAIPDAAYDAALRLNDTLRSLGIIIGNEPESATTLSAKNLPLPIIAKNLVTISSPTLSKIVYWLNQKSINLYAEQLLKTIAWKQGRKPTTANGVDEVQKFWLAKGIDPRSMNIYDGSGLSPGDRVTTLTLARILQSAKKESWFADFYTSLPVYNDMKMKSGSINNVLCYAGYQTKNGRELCFSIMVNNFSGPSRGIKEKMFRVLDELK